MAFKYLFVNYSRAKTMQKEVSLANLFHIGLEYTKPWSRCKKW